MASRTTSSPTAPDADASTPAASHSTTSTGRWYANGSRPTRRRWSRASLRIFGSGGYRRRRDSVARRMTAAASRIEITVSNINVALRERDLDLRRRERPVHPDRELAQELLSVLDSRPHA